MLKSIIITGFFIGLLSMMFFTPMKYARGIFKLEYGELERQDKVLSWIPFYNIAKAESIYTGHVSLVLLSTLLFIISLVVRIAAVFLMPSILMVQIATIIFLFVSLLLVYAANFYTVFIVLHDSGVCTLASCIFKSLFYPLGQYYIGTHLSVVMKNSAREEAVFK